MRLTKKIRRIWHDVYYALTGDSGVDFALRCREVAEIVDQGDEKLNFKRKVQFYLHLSVCQACKNYYEFAKFLKQKIQKLLNQRRPQHEIDELNKKLVDEFKKKES